MIIELGNEFKRTLFIPLDNPRLIPLSSQRKEERAKIAISISVSQNITDSKHNYADNDLVL